MCRMARYRRPDTACAREPFGAGRLDKGYSCLHDDEFNLLWAIFLESSTEQALTASVSCNLYTLSTMRNN